MKDRGGRAQSDFNRVGRAQEKSTGPVFGRGSPSCILFPCTTSKPYASAKHSRAKSLVTLGFSCWGYSCSCAYFQLLMRNVAVAQMKRRCIGVDLGLYTIRAITETTRS